MYHICSIFWSKRPDSTSERDIRPLSSLRAVETGLPRSTNPAAAATPHRGGHVITLRTQYVSLCPHRPPLVALTFPFGNSRTDSGPEPCPEAGMFRLPKSRWVKDSAHPVDPFFMGKGADLVDVDRVDCRVPPEPERRSISHIIGIMELGFGRRGITMATMRSPEIWSISFPARTSCLG
jgi:hypothetical protein